MSPDAESEASPCPFPEGKIVRVKLDNPRAFRDGQVGTVHSATHYDAASPKHPGDGGTPAVWFVWVQFKDGGRAPYVGDDLRAATAAEYAACPVYPLEAEIRRRRESSKPQQGKVARNARARTQAR